MMVIIRPIKKSDLDAFQKLADSASLGITNLPKNRALLEKKIEDSENALSKNIDTPGNEKYIFVLEDLETSEILGTSGILAVTSKSRPTYAYKIKTRSLKYDPKEISFIKAEFHKNSPSELAGLYLHPHARKGGFGKLLSYSRFLFIAAFKERFQKAFFAEIRGDIAEDGTCPFWEAVGRHFLDVDYQKLIKLTENDKSFIADILPKYPIYLPLLPKEAQESVGKAHEKSYAALKMLQQEGFSFKGEIDIFDGGPHITAKTSQIKAIKKSRTAKVTGFLNEELNNRYLIGNERLDFKAGFGQLKKVSKGAVLLEKKAADALKIKLGDTVRYIGEDP
ncbi:MAG TPA: arginine N-succinyltransferase [Parachlamydiaceae bacterium]|nr:arginine N-succinyltransferase [Parachlamydiaceae bacterium]